LVPKHIYLLHPVRLGIKPSYVEPRSVSANVRAPSEEPHDAEKVLSNCPAGARFWSESDLNLRRLIASGGRLESPAKGAVGLSDDAAVRGPNPQLEQPDVMEPVELIDHI
jgi:hypothetical protein